MRKKLGFLTLLFSLIGLFSVSAEASAADMLRVYNPNSGEHFYTSQSNEQIHLINTGWDAEGIGWTAPDSGNDVYRLYNPNGGDHHYTLDTYERNWLINQGWKNEGTGWYSDTNQGQAIYRLYNPNSAINNHHYTQSVSERDQLVAAGWQSEGIGWYGVATSTSENTTQTVNLTAIESNFLTIINNYRSQQGLSSLSPSSALTQAADIRNNEIETSFSHTRPNGSFFDSVLTDIGFSNYLTAGENLVQTSNGTASDYEIAEYAFTLWQNSPGHNANMLGDYDQIGIDFQINGSIVYGTNLFAKSYY